MPEELFRTRIVSRDPRYPSIVSLCSYSMAGIFLGMFLTLSGVMLTSMDEPMAEHHKHHFDDQFGPELHNQTRPALEEKGSLRNIVGLVLLISGCVLILISMLSLMFASLLYLRTTTEPPESNETDPEPNTVWNYLDSVNQDKPPRQILENVDKIQE